MPGHAADHNLLFGILALQMDFISRDDLIAAMGAWVLAKHRPLGDILVEAGSLDAVDCALLETMVVRHVAKHGGDPIASLAAVASIGSTASLIQQKISDPDVLVLITHVISASRYDPHATQIPSTIESPDYPNVTRVPDLSNLHPFAATDRIAVRYRKLRDHAQGGLGIVYVAVDEELKREVALKEIKTRFADDKNSQKRFIREAEITGGLEHPGIVPVYGMGSYDDGRPFYAMRFIRGESFEKSVNNHHASNLSIGNNKKLESLAFRQLLQIFINICNAIDYAHSRGVLHRDLKPANVMLGLFGETLVVDWGLAKVIGREESELFEEPVSQFEREDDDDLALTQFGAIIGTPAYMSPEQAQGFSNELKPSSDIYSLGGCLYYLLTNRAPIVGNSLEEVLNRIVTGKFSSPRGIYPTIPSALEAICLKAMSLRPENRYKSARKLVEDIEQWLADGPVAAHPESTPQKVSRWVRRHQTLFQAWFAACIAAILILIASIVVVVMAKSDVIVARDNERKAFQKSRESDRIARQHLARLLFEQASSDLSGGFRSRGMLRLSHALRAADEAGDVALQNLVRLEFGANDPLSQSPRARHKLSESIETITFNLDGTQIAYVDRTNNIGIINLDGDTMRSWKVDSRSKVNRLLFSPDALHLYIALEDGHLVDADVSTGEQENFPAVSSAPLANLGICKDGTLVTVSNSWEIRRWNIEERTETGKPFTIHLPTEERNTMPYKHFRYSGKDYFVRLSKKNECYIWNTAEPGYYEKKFPGGEIEITAVALDTDSDLLYVRTQEGSIQIWKTGPKVVEARSFVDIRVRTSEDLLARLSGPATTKWIGQVPMRSIAYKLDDAGRIRMIETDTGKNFGISIHKDEKVSSAAVSPEGRHVAYSTENREISVWRVPDAIAGSAEQIDLSVHLWLGSQLRDRPMQYRSKVSTIGKFELTNNSDPFLQPLTMDQRTGMRQRLAEIGGSISFE